MAVTLQLSQIVRIFSKFNCMSFLDLMRINIYLKLSRQFGEEITGTFEKNVIGLPVPQSSNDTCDQSWLLVSMNAVP